MRCRWVFATVLVTAVASALAGGCSGGSEPVSTTTAGAGGEPSQAAAQTVAPEVPSTGPGREVLLPYPWDEVALAAVSADELWASENGEDGSLFRYRGAGWEEVVPEVPWFCSRVANFYPDFASGPTAVVATDGAIWTTTAAGLVRFVDDVGQSITVGARGCVAFPGPDSGVWLPAVCAGTGGHRPSG